MTFQELNSIDGVQFMPVMKDKRPIHKNWESVRAKYDFTGAVACGIVCGSISGNIEAIDFDLKYDITGTMMNDYIEAVNSIKPGLISRMLVQKTVSNGYHIIYRCSYIEGNQKIANREATLEEKNNTYYRSLEKKLSELGGLNDVNDPKFQEASVMAKRAMDNDKVRVLIETRGEKGYIACYPTPGYEIIQGDYRNIPTITEEERELLFDVAFSFNSYLPKKEQKRTDYEQRKNIKGLSPSEDYDQRGDVVGLLESHGWTVTGRRGPKILMKRPGDTKAKSSGNFDEDTNRFSVFSTSTEFNSQQPYKRYAVFAMLECNGDFSQVTKKLADLGYGDPIEKIRENNSHTVVPSVVDMTDDDDLSFLATDQDYSDYLDKWMNGTFELGKSTGIPSLDNHFLFKEGNLVINNGIDNVGKSIITWYLMFLAAFFNGWKTIIFSSENKVGAVKKKIMEFYWCKTVKSMSKEEYNKAEEFFNNHFRMIKNGNKLYNYQDLINMIVKTKKVFNANCVLVDPYNSLAVESKQTYEFHYQTASELKLFAEINSLSIYLNAHVGTGAAKKKDEQGHTLAPQKEDTEMGVMFANKADDFITTHRLTQHPTEYIYTEIHVRKIKDTETGGKPTPIYKPVLLRSIPGLVGFVAVSSKSSTDKGFNPVENYWNGHSGQVDAFKIPDPNKFIEPFNGPVSVLDNDEAPF